jgi:hypothetical protein
MNQASVDSNERETYVDKNQASIDSNMTYLVCVLCTKTFGLHSRSMFFILVRLVSDPKVEPRGGLAEIFQNVGFSKMWDFHILSPRVFSSIFTQQCA